MADPNVEEVDVLVQKHILKDLTDEFFRNGPVFQYLKRNRYKTFPGGSKIQSGFLFKPMKGGPYLKGSQFDISKRRTRAAMLFDPKFYQISVSEFLEDIEVSVRGPMLVMDMVKTDLANAAMTLSAILEVALWHHGQDLTGVGGADRSAHINGIPEALNDGVTAGWDGSVFPVYGEETRASVAPALHPAGGRGWVGASANPVVTQNVDGALNYRFLEHSYATCRIGRDFPILGITSNRGMAFVGENFQPHQRLDTTEPTIGWPGIKFKQATLIESQYIPSQDGVDDPDIGNYRLADSELFAWINPGPEGDGAYIQLQVSASPRFQFGWTGFKTAQDSTMVAGQFLFSGNVIFRSVRTMRIHHGIKR